MLLATTISAPAGDCTLLRRLAASAQAAGQIEAARRAWEAVEGCDAPTATRPLAAETPQRCQNSRASVAELHALGGDARPFEGLLTGCPESHVPTSSTSLQSAQINSPYGWRQHPILKRRKHHDGVDLDARLGDPVPAIAAGTVARAQRAGNYGLLIELDHGGGKRTRYAHNSELLVAEGDRVQAGQPLARAGSTGMSTGVHVHLEVRLDGRPVDPMPYLRNPELLSP